MGRDILQHRLTTPEGDNDARHAVSDSLHRRGLDQGPESVAAILGLPWMTEHGTWARDENTVRRNPTPAAQPNARGRLIGPNSKQQFLAADWLGWGEWVHQAACRGHDPELWAIEGSITAENEAAMAICETCPVKQECDAEAQSWRDVGVIRGGHPYMPYWWWTQNRTNGSEILSEQGHGS